MNSCKIGADFIFPISGEPIRNGYVEVNQDGVVTSLGELASIEKDSVEFYNGIICPGFVNSHCHIELSHLKDKFVEKSGMSGFINQINALRESAPADERGRIMKREFDKLYQEGVSAMADISNCDESFQMKQSSPLYTRTYLEVFGSEPQDADSVMEGVTALQAKAHSMGIDAAPTPHSPYTMSPRLVELSSAEGLKAGFLSYHNQESQEEEDLLISGTGALAQNYKGRGMSTPPVTGKPALFYFLDRLKQIHQAPFYESILLVHNVATGEESIDAANEVLKNATWVTCPLSNLFIHDALAPLHLLRRKGVSIAIGTDSLSSNHILSMAEEIKTIQNNFKDIELNEILLWATLNGAKALRKESVFGSIEVGKSPGLVHIDNIDLNNLSLTKESKSKRVL